MTTNPTLHHQLISRLFKDNYDWLCTRIRGRLGHVQGAEDIAADTFERVLRLPDPGSIREPRALLTTIAQRLLYESWRREDLERAYVQSLMHLPEDVHPSPEEHHLLIEALLELDKLLDDLPSQGKAAFIYRHFSDMTYEQIARQLGVTAPRVHQYMVQAYRCCMLALSQA